jgi:hypothetical protein
MAPLDDPFMLAGMCAGCHVGEPGREVTHDMIAAGHPRLAFELGSFLANMPAHWKPRPRSETKRWAVGQVVAAEQALMLLKHQAETANAAWPELAGYDCFSCHSGLTKPSGRRASRSKHPGRLTWGSWYLAMPRALARDLDPGSELAAELDRLAEVLARLRSSREEVGPAVEKTLCKLDLLKRRLRDWPETADFARARIDGLLAGQADGDWDVAEQTYLGVSALNRLANDAEIRGRLENVQSLRAFPPGFQGPSSLPGIAFDGVEFFRRLRP